MLMVHWLLNSAGRSELLLTLLTTWATLALGLTWLTALLLRRAVPALRYCVWQFGLLSLLAVPLVFAALPGVPLGFSLSAMETADPPAALPAEIANRVSDAGNGSLARAFADDQPRADFSAWHPPTNAARPALAASTRLASDSRAPRVAAVAAEAPSVRGWPSLLAAIWLCGAALQALGLITSAVLARGLLRSARPLDDERFRRAADDLRRRLSLTRQVQLFQSERVGIPIVVGVLRPRVLLPADCRNWSSRRMEMVLLHELAHIERRDLAWLLSARLVATVYWFHPLVWLALVRMRLECERACDDRVLLAGMEPTDYAQGLVECASARRGRSPRLTLGIAMAQPSQLESRVRSILDASLARGPASARMRRGLLLAAACLVFGLGIVRPFSPRAANAVASEQQEGTTTASAAQPPAKEATPPAPASIFDDQGTQPTNGKLRLLVTDADGKPLEGVKIRGDVWAANETSPAYPRDHSDADGRATIELPARLSILRLWFSKDGYVSTSERWEQHPAEKRRRVPEQLTVALRTGTVLGGTVVDEDEMPVAGAVVQLFRGDTELMPRDVKTDQAGRWRIDSAPPENDGEFRVLASHPDFISLYSYYDHRQAKLVPIEQLRAQSARTVLQTGARIIGKITDPDGNPVAGALAIYGDRPYWEHHPQQEVRSDESGSYRLPPLPDGKMRVTIVAKGWMPAMREVQVGPDLKPQDFRLQPGKTLRVRVVDPDGRPLQAHFHVREWRGVESLYNADHPNVLDSHIPRATGADGIYEWTWAPDDAVKFQISAGEAFSTPQEDLVADGQQHDFTLLPVLRIRGTVVDASTGKPIERFTVVPVEQINGLDPLTVRHKARERTGGSYLMDEELDQNDRSYRVRIEADGYLSALGESFRIGQRKATSNFRLRPGIAATGRIVDPQGQPAAGVCVFLASHTQEVNFASRDPDDEVDFDFRLISGPDGEFKFPAQFEPYTLFVLGESGCAEVGFEPNQAAGTIRLQPYARVAGRLLQAGKPVAGAQIELRSLQPRLDDQPDIRKGQGTKTDDAGRFVFEKVAPQKCLVWAELSPWQDYPITSSQLVPLDLKPGQDVTLELGGGGGTAVTGRVELAEAEEGQVDFNWSLNYLLRKVPGIEPPAEIAQAGFDWRKGWNDAWTDTPEGQAYLATLHHDFVKLGHDGTFFINALPAGDYELALRLYHHEAPQTCLANPSAQRVVKFRVTEADVARGKLDLGRIEARPIGH